MYSVRSTSGVSRIDESNENVDKSQYLVKVETSCAVVEMVNYIKQRVWSFVENVRIYTKVPEDDHL